MKHTLSFVPLYKKSAIVYGFMIFKQTKFNLAKQIVSKNVNTFNRKKIVQNDLKKKTCQVYNK